MLVALVDLRHHNVVLLGDRRDLIDEMRLVTKGRGLAEEAVQPLDDLLEVDRLASGCRRSTCPDGLEHRSLIWSKGATAGIFPIFDVVAGQGNSAEIDRFGCHPIKPFGQQLGEGRKVLQLRIAEFDELRNVGIGSGEPC